MDDTWLHNFARQHGLVYNGVQEGFKHLPSLWLFTDMLPESPNYESTFAIPVGSNEQAILAKLAQTRSASGMVEELLDYTEQPLINTAKPKRLKASKPRQLYVYLGEPHAEEPVHAYPAQLRATGWWATLNDVIDPSYIEDAWLVTGKAVGLGSNTEPLLSNVEYLHRISPTPDNANGPWIIVESEAVCKDMPKPNVHIRKGDGFHYAVNTSEPSKTLMQSKTHKGLRTKLISAGHAIIPESRRVGDAIHALEANEQEEYLTFSGDRKSKPKYKNVSCSQCGKDFGPGDHGFSDCKSHRKLAKKKKVAESAMDIISEWTTPNSERNDDPKPKDEKALPHGEREVKKEKKKWCWSCRGKGCEKCRVSEARALIARLLD